MSKTYREQFEADVAYYKKLSVPDLLDIRDRLQVAVEHPERVRNAKESQRRYKAVVTVLERSRVVGVAS